MENIDIRAHVSATTTYEADERYKAQAAAYLAFQPTKHTSLKSRGDAERLSARRQPATTAPDQTTYLEDTQLAISALESQLFTLPEPERRTVEHVEAKYDNPDTILPVEHSQSPDAPHTNSSHLRTPIFHRPAKRQHRTSESDSNPSTRRVRRRNAYNTPTKALNQHGEQIGSPLPEHIDADTTSELPTTYSISDLASERSRSLKTIRRSISDPGPEHTTHEPASIPSDTHSPLARRKSHQDSATNQNTVREPTTTALISCKTILPPPPPVSNEPFKTHVTERLNYLSNALEMEDVYAPRDVKRALRIFERGHWQFSCSDWSLPLRTDFWTFLQDFIASGGAGWGIFCVFSNDNKILIYCWGEVVRHIYLLLYVASQSKIRKLGLQWIDAANEIVVQM